MFNTVSDEDVTEIPPAWCDPGPLSSCSGPTVVFDLETTGLGCNSCITQIAAATSDHAKAFSTYVLPDCPISAKATEVTGICVRRIGGKSVLEVNGKEVVSLSIQDALKAFHDWLSSFQTKPFLWPTIAGYLICEFC